MKSKLFLLKFAYIYIYHIFTMHGRSDGSVVPLSVETATYHWLTLEYIVVLLWDHVSGTSLIKRQTKIQVNETDQNYMYS